MHWMTLFLVTVGIGLLGMGWLQLVLAGIALLLVAFVVWFLDVVIEEKEDTQ